MSGSDFSDPDDFWSIIPSRTVVLISGYARAGKDTLGQGLLEWSVKNSDKVNFADELKDSANLWIDSVGLTGVGNFFHDEFKSEHRDVLVSLGSFARKFDQDVWARMLCENIQNCVDDDGIPFETVICTDWRYLNELTCVQRNLIPAGWKVKTVYVETKGIGPANEEEERSIGFMRKFVKFDQEYYFESNSRNHILSEGRALAKYWRL
jgi:hypothetical protein